MTCRRSTRWKKIEKIKKKNGSERKIRRSGSESKRSTGLEMNKSECCVKNDSKCSDKENRRTEIYIADKRRLQSAVNAVETSPLKTALAKCS